MTLTDALTRRLAAAALLLCALAAAGIAVLVTAATPERATAQPVEVTTVAAIDDGGHLTKGDRKLLAAVVGPGIDLPPLQAVAIIEAVDRVCEGLTAGVPVVVMADELVATLGLTDTEARQLVNTAAVARC